MEFVDYIPTHKLDSLFLHGYLSEKIEVTLCLTGHHLILSCRQENIKELCVSINIRLFVGFKDNKKKLIIIIIFSSYSIKMLIHLNAVQII